MRLILASQSRRRADLLTAAGIGFEARPVDIDESPLPGEAPAAYVARLARAKAEAVRSDGAAVPVLGADTVVVVDGEALGKPVDDQDAIRMLRRLAGRVHEVMTGVALRVEQRTLECVETTEVRFLPMSEAEIAWYVATGEPHDKAGAYAIQGRGSVFIDRIVGSYSNVVGLPVATVYRMLRDVSAGGSRRGRPSVVRGVWRPDTGV